MADKDDGYQGEIPVRSRRRIARKRMRKSDVPATLILSSLIAGLICGLIVNRLPPAILGIVLGTAGPIGTMWLNGLQMTILPLVASLLFIGVITANAAAQAGSIARNTFVLFGTMIFLSALVGAFVTPLLLGIAPLNPAAADVFANASQQSGNPLGTIPAGRDFVASIIPANIFAALSQGAMLPVMIFALLFALAALRLPPDQRNLFIQLFEGLSQAMLTIVGWVFRLAPLGVFAIGLGLGASQGIALTGVLFHYILIVTSVGTVVLIGAYLIPIVVIGRKATTFARAVAPAQALALSTQSSLACLPAMLDGARRLQLRESTADFVLPMAVSLFKATSPAMNLAVALYIAHWAGVTVSPSAIAAGIAVAALVSIASPGLPGSISFIASIAPICLAMGIPIAPLAILMAVEVVPDLMRTVGNVTVNVAVAEVVDRLRGNIGAALDEPGL